MIDVPGSGPNTYENRRRIGGTTEVRYHDLFAGEFARRGFDQVELGYNSGAAVAEAQRCLRCDLEEHGDPE